MEDVYYIIDTAGRVWCGPQRGFDSYYVNDAIFMSFEDAKRISSRYKYSTVHSRF